MESEENNKPVELISSPKNIKETNSSPFQKFQGSQNKKEEEREKISNNFKSNQHLDTWTSQHKNNYLVTTANTTNTNVNISANPPVNSSNFPNSNSITTTSNSNSNYKSNKHLYNSKHDVISDFKFLNKSLVDGKGMIHKKVTPNLNNTLKTLTNIQTHKVSLKNSLNKNRSNMGFSKFEMNISELSEVKDKCSEPSDILKPNIHIFNHVFGNKDKEIQIVFIVHKAEWANGKSKSL
jgi:hypothetical protein